MAPSWVGLYYGIEGGGAIGDTNQIADGPLGFGPVTSGYEAVGGLIGGTVGYNWEADNWVLGLEGDMSWANIKGSAHNTPPFTPGGTDGTQENWLATGRGRFGWIFLNNTMLYVSGGAAAASVEAIITPAAAAVRTDTETRWGGAIGGGVEARLTPNWSLKAEYLYVKFQSQKYFAVPPPGTNTRSDVPLDNKVIRFGINYALQ
jgi:outer membrane immunogenic protein